jgi:UDP-GlcNAc:undecaprenyl-phosphate GlcNAc-1-phosphate transferase
MVDVPNARKIHRTPIPLLGGVAIYCGTVSAIIGFAETRARGQIVGILAASTLLLVVGILDDRHLLHHQVKLFIAMPLAALTLVALGVRAHVASAFFPGPAGSMLDIGLTLFWVVGITAAYNIFDHMDGLASGVTAIASLFFTILAVREGQVLVATLGAALLGGSLGFLMWNFNPAKIFMGDGGAMFLGFMVATLGLKLRFHDVPEASSWMIPVLLLIVPIFDTTLVCVSRSRRGLLPFASPGKDHTAHRLANVGLGQRGAVLVLYAVGAVSGLLALLVCGLSVKLALALAVFVAAAALLAVIMLERFPYERQEVGGRS